MKMNNQERKQFADTRRRARRIFAEICCIVEGMEHGELMPMPILQVEDLITGKTQSMTAEDSEAFLAALKGIALIDDTDAAQWTVTEALGAKLVVDTCADWPEWMQKNKQRPASN
jgi:hypothetical protein